MAVLIISSIGATHKYPNCNMMKRTFHGFINSLIRQTSQDFHLFLSCHDILFEYQFSWLHWCPVSVDEQATQTYIPIKLPTNVQDGVKYMIVEYGSAIGDMGRKLLNSMIQAIFWASKNQLTNFWMLRMDSDDLLDKRHIEFLNNCEADAVYNKTCHMFDMQSNEAAIHRYPYSTTCNAIKLKIEEDGTVKPNWYYHYNDHTKFEQQVRTDGLLYKVRDFSLCITTNSTNSISGRPAIREERFIDVIPRTKELDDRYGLGEF